MRRDLELAGQWYSKAAAQGHALAQRNLVQLQQAMRPSDTDPNSPAPQRVAPAKPPSILEFGLTVFLFQDALLSKMDAARGPETAEEAEERLEPCEAGLEGCYEMTIGDDPRDYERQKSCLKDCRKFGRYKSLGNPAENAHQNHTTDCDFGVFDN